MKLIRELYRPDVALVSIGDRHTMGPLLLSAGYGQISRYPSHYYTTPDIEQDPADFQALI